MLTQLHIKNFRLFKDLEISDLKRVNLFAGKNNSGKTALLEALRIMAAGQDLSVMLSILQQRGEQGASPWEQFDSFFYRPELRKHRKTGENVMIFRVNDFQFERINKGDKNTDYNLHSNERSNNTGQLLINIPNPLIPRDQYIYVPFSANEYYPLSRLWDEIVLTPQEDKVIAILRATILPNIIRLDVQQNDRILIRLEGEDKPIPLKNLGDGVQRIFHIALALVSAENKVLLIDEIETGLHYSVMENIWEIIFQYSEALNVQVFATTHSQDAIKAFTYLLDKPENEENGIYFRLQANRKSGDIEAIAYTQEHLALSLESNLDPR